MNEMIKAFNTFSPQHDKFQLFYDFLQFSAIAIHNAVKKCPKREQQFIQTRNRYSETEFVQFQQLLALLTEALENKPYDVLGSVFMALELSDKKLKGQCYTPSALTHLCGQLTLNDEKQIEQQIQQYGYYRYYEPCIGGGALAIGFSERFKALGYHPQHQLLVIGQDIDLKAVYMSYVQLSLLGIPAIIQHANPLTKEIFENWLTPFYSLQPKFTRKPYEMVSEN